MTSSTRKTAPLQLPRVRRVLMWWKLAERAGIPVSREALPDIIAAALVDQTSNGADDLKRAAIYERDGWRCVYCGSEDGLTFDHLIPKSRGGSKTPENVVTACWDCNQKRGTTYPPPVMRPDATAARALASALPVTEAITGTRVRVLSARIKERKANNIEQVKFERESKKRFDNEGGYMPWVYNTTSEVLLRESVLSRYTLDVPRTAARSNDDDEDHDDRSAEDHGPDGNP